MSAKNNAADRQRMRELIEERKKKLADLQEKNKQAAVKTPGGAAATPEKSGLGGIGSPMTPSRPGSSMGTADVLAMVDTLVSPSVSTPSKILSTPTLGDSSLLDSLRSPSTPFKIQTAVLETPGRKDGPAPVTPRRKLVLTAQHGIGAVDIAPRVRLEDIQLYSRGTQTDASNLFPTSDKSSDEHAAAGGSEAPTRRTRASSLIRHQQKLAAAQHGASVDGSTSTEGTSNDNEHEDTEESDDDELEINGSGMVDSGSQTDKVVAKQLSAVEKESIATSSTFQSFLKKTSVMMDRALMMGDSFNFTRVADGDDDDLKRRAIRGSLWQGGAGGSDVGLTLAATLSDDQWAKDQQIFDLDWSPFDPSKLITVCYSPEQSSSILEWNLDYDGRVETRHHHTSKITAARYWSAGRGTTSSTAAQNKLILGGSYTGQLVLWDATSPSFKPIQTISNASMSTGAVSPHQHPIYSIRPIDSRYFVTTDTMGTLAVWDINELRKPVELLELTWVKSSLGSLSAGDVPGDSPSAGSPLAGSTAGSATHHEVAVTSVAFKDDNTFYVTSEDGQLYQGQRHGDHIGLVQSFKAHDATTSSISMHPNPLASQVLQSSSSTPANFSDCFLTGSLDWSVCLWNPKLSNQPLARFTNFDDYVTDVKWSPVHPASFAAVDSSGALSVWNMNVEKETPIATNIQAKSALLRLAWSPHIQTRANAGSSSTPSDMFIAATTHHSNVFIYKLDRNVAMPAEDDWAKFDATVKEFVSSRNGADQTSGGLGGLMDSSAFSSAQSLDFSSI